jgi:hypothetical protein
MPLAPSRRAGSSGPHTSATRATPGSRVSLAAKARTLADDISAIGVEG